MLVTKLLTTTPVPQNEWMDNDVYGDIYIARIDGIITTEWVPRSNDSMKIIHLTP